MDRDETARQLEDRWFKEHERRLIEKKRAEREAHVKSLEGREDHARHEELKRLHWMCCPKCGHAMTEQDLPPVKVDTCTACEGIFFDRGELETLLLQRRESRKGVFRHLLGLS